MDGRTALLSVNINGLYSLIKRKQTFSKLQKQNADITCLQEVHISKQHEDVLESPKLGKLHLALTNKKKRGVAVYIKDCLNPRQIYNDEDGRMLLIEITIDQKKILLVTIYAPNTNKKEFYFKLHCKIIETEQVNVCIVGDYNTVSDIEKDYKSSKKN
uniref:exodeoxyribonuclease III n=1 Tax=Micrurus paraensis TaxID=1970185 RepID=A0A2D4KI06_9SAUR